MSRTKGTNNVIHDTSAKSLHRYLLPERSSPKISCFFLDRPTLRYLRRRLESVKSLELQIEFMGASVEIYDQRGAFRNEVVPSRRF
ncbi:hypothetical protein M404DRAFT_836083 [Pisolithus tinctorius Marx 270]|uniref:Uncharacterized protein n=1 Tax=Pisolithus tinctorius Marx 270 TaxID=870435 RepID=A0A0C3PRG0_PISTI|nr:hypothetical protein M404DRAFT_836083 [Pisolithus tinctorius Marx 270]